MSKRSKERSPAGHNPFQDLDAVLERAGLRLNSSDSHAPSLVKRQPDDSDAPSPVERQPDDSEETLFSRAMQGVVRSSWRHAPIASPFPSLQSNGSQELEDLRLMQAAIEGDSLPSMFDHPEYIEGWVDLAGKRFLPHLRSGLYSIQGQIDLHGLSQTEARHLVEDFILNMACFRECCVKIIHGRGLNSNDKAVLKDSLQRWFSTRRLARYVVAYASAPAKDGGVGAIYVLLRRAGGSRRVSGS
jgi:DNA-nicking Smr family endonuclease